jgi:hypothetical protein
MGSLIKELLRLSAPNGRADDAKKFYSSPVVKKDIRGSKKVHGWCTSFCRRRATKLS